MKQERTLCEMCCGSCYIEEPDMRQVTRDMAIAGGDRSLEGRWIEWGTERAPCPECHGEGFAPPGRAAGARGARDAL